MVIVVLPFGVRLRYQRDLRETLGFGLCGLIEYSCVLFSRRLRWLRRGNAASCIISQIKTDWGSCGYCGLLWFWGSSASSARSAGDIGVFFVLIDWVLSCEYSPADSADYAEECSKLHYSAEKRQLVANFVLWLLLFWGLSASSARSAGDIGVSFVWIDRVLLRVILPQIAQITQRNAASCIIPQIKTVSR